MNPFWGHVLARHYEDKEMTFEDAHDTNYEEMRFLVVKGLD